MVNSMGNCNIENGRSMYMVKFAGSLNILADNENDMLNKLVNLLKTNDIVLEKTISVKNIGAKNK